MPRAGPFVGGLRLFGCGHLHRSLREKRHACALRPGSAAVRSPASLSANPGAAPMSRAVTRTLASPASPAAMNEMAYQVRGTARVVPADHNDEGCIAGLGQGRAVDAAPLCPGHMVTDLPSARTADLAGRLVRVEPLRLAARRTEVLRLAAYLLVGLLFLALLAAAPLGTLWLLGSFVTRHMAAIVATLFGSVAGVFWLAIATFRRLSRLGADVEPRYHAAFRDEVIAPTLSEALPGAEVVDGAAAGATTLDASGLFAREHDRVEVSLAVERAVAAAPLRLEVLRAWRRGYSYDRNQSVGVTVFRGLLARVARGAELPGTVRVVDQEVYAGADRPHWGVVRRRGTVRVTQPAERLDNGVGIVLDEGMSGAPPVAYAIARLWPRLREAVGGPVFVSVDASGTYLACPTPASGRALLEASLVTANDAEELAGEVERLRRVVEAAGWLAETVASAGVSGEGVSARRS